MNNLSVSSCYGARKAKN